MEKYKNYTDFTNLEILNGRFRLVFNGRCEVPGHTVMNVFIPDKPWYDGPKIRLYLDPEGLYYGDIICSTLVRAASFRDDKLSFPRQLTPGEWQTFYLTDYKEIFGRKWKERQLTCIARKY